MCSCVSLLIIVVVIIVAVLLPTAEHHAAALRVLALSVTRPQWLLLRRVAVSSGLPYAMSS